jgi:hypothetical protein
MAARRFQWPVPSFQLKPWFTLAGNRKLVTGNW